MKEIRLCISCSCNCKKNGFIYPYLLPIMFIFIRLCHDRLLEIKVNNFKALKYHLPNLFYLYLPKILSIIFIPIIKYRTKSDSTEVRLSQKRYHLIKQKASYKRMLLLFFLISFLEVIQEIGDYILYYYQRVGQLHWLIEKKSVIIIFVPIFCYYILNIDLHRHHILALIIGLIGAIIINMIRFVLHFSWASEFLFHLINAVYSAILSLALVLIKYVLSTYVFITPYIFLFYDGLFCILNSFILVLLEYYIIINLPEEPLKNDNVNYFKNNFLGIAQIFNFDATITSEKKREYIVCFFVSFFFTFIYYIIETYTIYNYSPFLLIIVETCLPIDSDFIEYIFMKERREEEFFLKEKIVQRSISQIIGYTIILIAALILNEIIILNFCGLNKNTYSKISLRGEVDASNLIELSNKEDNTTDESIDEIEGDS